MCVLCVCLCSVAFAQHRLDSRALREHMLGRRAGVSVCTCRRAPVSYEMENFFKIDPMDACTIS